MNGFPNFAVMVETKKIDDATLAFLIIQTTSVVILTFFVVVVGNIVTTRIVLEKNKTKQGVKLPPPPPPPPKHTHTHTHTIRVCTQEQGPCPICKKVPDLAFCALSSNVCFFGGSIGAFVLICVVVICGCHCDRVGVVVPYWSYDDNNDNDGSTC